MESREARTAIQDNVLNGVSNIVWVNLWSKIQNSLRQSVYANLPVEVAHEVWDDLQNTVWGSVLDNVWLIVYANVTMSIKTHIPNEPLSNK
jgi:hypothetical protein